MAIRSFQFTAALALLAGAACATSPAYNAATSKASYTEGRTPSVGMTRHPAVSSDKIVFSYADDLWVIPRAGGVANPLVSPIGLETYPRFSPDGQTVAFTGNYDGDVDIYTIGVDGGIPERVTHHPENEILNGWSADGNLLFHSRGFGGLPQVSKLFTVAPSGGMPVSLPVPYGTYGAISADGRWLAYSPASRVGRTWKRYRGGLASDIWLFEFATGSARQLTNFEGTDVMPMWHGEKLYFVSDAGPKHRQNLWVIDDISNGDRRQVTEFDDDVRYASSGAGAIVFIVGSELRLLDLASEESNVVDFKIPGAQPKLRSKVVDASKFISMGNWDISPSAKRVAVEARGDLWTLPAEKGTPRNLTRTDGVYEREPTWSPDGRWIAFMSDETGEYELYVIQSDGKGETRQVTTDGSAFRYSINWSPDSTMISLLVKGGFLKIIDVESGEITAVDEHNLAQYPTTFNASWSHDSHWMAYIRPGEESWNSSIYLYDVDNKTSHQVTSDYFDQSAVTFDREGDYLYFSGVGSFNPTYSGIDSTWIYRDESVLHVVPLRADMPSPFAEEIDEETWGDEDEEGDENEDEEGDDDSDEEEVTGDDEGDASGDDSDEDGEEGEDDEDEEEEPLKIDTDGFEHRAIRLPIGSGSFYGLSVSKDGALLYVRAGSDETKVQTFDVSADEPKEEDVLSGVRGFRLTAKGDKMLYQKAGSPQIGGVGADAKGEAVSTDGMRVTIDPRAEWAQILHDVWILNRDFFYVENMHGVDWDAAYAKYAALLEHAVSRIDLAYIMGEFISELNVGHAYTGGGDIERPSNTNVGMLGADYALENGAYRITALQEGGVWDTDARGPLSQPGVDVAVGDYLLAVNGIALDASKDPWAAFTALSGKLVTLTVSEQPTIDDDAREIVVTAAGSERNLRYRSWIEAKRKYVEEKSGGKIAYVYVPSTGIPGQNDLVRQYYAQLELPALIVDDRWNQGGQIPTRFVELLNRPVLHYFARREGRDWKFPYDGHQGPKCMLINGSAGSGGDAFPSYFKQMGLGKLVGMRTWGGLVGISGNPGLIDGARITIPTFGYYESDGTWGIEGHGVDPDIMVVDDPSKMLDGGDPQLDAAIALMLAELEEKVFNPPARPAGPDRSGMGVTEEDR
ncbi:MAG: tricorn protease [Planctomycetota bacterium]|jgi:tricorn protease